MENIYDADQYLFPILGLENYETMYGIRDHRLTDDPLAVYLANDAELTYGVTMRETYAAKFIDEKVDELTGIPLHEWFDLEIHQAEFYLDLAIKTNQTRMEQEKKIIEDLEKEDRRREQFKSTRSKLKSRK